MYPELTQSDCTGGLFFHGWREVSLSPTFFLAPSLTIGWKQESMVLYLPPTTPHDHMKKAVQKHNTHSNGGLAERETMNLNLMIELLNQPNLKPIFTVNSLLCVCAQHVQLFLLHEINKCLNSRSSFEMCFLLLDT